MLRLGLRGVERGKGVKTTVSDRATPCPRDVVNRQFQSERPNALWVSDFTAAFARAGAVSRPGRVRVRERDSNPKASGVPRMVFPAYHQYPHHGHGAGRVTTLMRSRTGHR